MYKRIQSSLVAVALVGAAGCGASYEVVRAAEPNPYPSGAAFVVLPVTYENIQVGKMTESAYLSTKSESSRRSWEGDKAAIDREFARALVEASAERGIRIDRPSVVAADAPRFTIRPVVSFLEPGFFAGPARHASEVSMRVVIATADGRALDEVELESETMGSLFHPTTRSRFENDGEELAKSLAEYLGGRVTATN